MKYRKYKSGIIAGATAVLVLGLMSCASNTRSPDSVDAEGEGGRTEQQKERAYDGREPSSLRGDFTWLNDVEDNFGKIAAETSNRAVASQSKQEILLKQKDWSFSYLPKTNHFYVSVHGTTYQMIQTRINDGERFAFAAEGQAENPLTFSVMKTSGRKVASGEWCETEISFWNKKSRTYVTDHAKVMGKSCERMLTLLKDYVP